MLTIYTVGLGIAIVISAGCLIYYAFILFLLIRGDELDSHLSEVRAKLVANSVAAMGLPFCAFGAFALVFVFNARFGAPVSDEPTKIEFFSLSFSGPSGPVTLWVVCYLALVLSIRIVLRLRDNPSSGPSDRDA